MPQKSKKTNNKKKSEKKSGGGSLLPTLLATMVIVVAILASYFVYITYLKEPEPAVTNPDGTAVVHYIDVGQGDATLIVSPTGETMLIDAGERGDAADYLKKLNIKTLDYLVFTHYDFDHIGGGDDVLELCEVKNVLASDYEPHNKTGKTLITLIEEEGANFIHPDKGETFSLGEIQMEVLTKALTSDTKHSDENENSIVMMMTFGANKFLFTGDAEKERESEIIESYGKKLDSDVYKAGHHGADNASSAELMKLVTPDYGVFSCGVGNKYDHPRQGAIDRVAKYAETILRTDLHGDILITTDGEAITYETEKTTTQNPLVGLSITYYAILPEKAYLAA